MISFWVTALAALLILVVLFKRSIIIVPPRSFSIVERLGQFRRVLRPGFHLLVPALDHLRRIHWSYLDQDESLARISGTVISCDNCQLDIHPINAKTNDELQVTADVTIMYSVPEPEAAVYHTDDVLNLFYQAAVQSVRNVIADTSSNNLSGKDVAIGTLICSAINRAMQGKGISCNSIIVQEIAWQNEEILAQNQAILVEARQNEMNLRSLKQKSQLESERAKIELARVRAELAQKDEIASSEVQRDIMRAEGKAKAAAARFTSMKEAGFSIDQILELERIHQMSALAASDNKVIYLPSEMASNARMHLHK